MSIDCRGKEEIINIVMAEHKDAVSGILQALVDNVSKIDDSSN
jgi:dsDNA-binding SOS-regulon protein